MYCKRRADNQCAIVQAMIRCYMYTDNVYKGLFLDKARLCFANILLFSKLYLYCKLETSSQLYFYF